MPQTKSEMQYEVLQTAEDKLKLSLSGRMDANSLGQLWTELIGLVKERNPQQLVIDAAGITYCDGAGVGFFLECMHWQQTKQGVCTVDNLRPEFQKLLDTFSSLGKTFHLEPRPVLDVKGIEFLGNSFLRITESLKDQIAFCGELAVHLLKAFKNPLKNLRWADIYLVIQRNGLEALPIVLLVNFLMGLIMAFQAAIPMRQFGADVYVADLVSLSILRVLGPLMTAIILAGRTGSAFAAELGTMKVNEEINALYTMGLNPVRFLVINRVLAVIILIPVLTLFADLAGLLGGAVVFKSFGYPMITYVKQVINAIRINDFLGGFVKSFVFGFLIAAVGCLRGIQTKTGASAVGQSATSAVVSGLVLIIVTEGTFAVIYYVLGI
ncbi:MAG: MlaE family lipid ABC transporter permease subunit [Candidatus Omnitrophica bacterium]|nr:MlaE family lipid ABC transporter permease subunit [Candidatus Omnitrophota bacterium]MCB9747271.1 MlaE family lipid ABC transporter permease subunit [Candidatus Omnitrophota bacterium]